MTFWVPTYCTDLRYPWFGPKMHIFSCRLHNYSQRKVAFFMANLKILVRAILEHYWLSNCPIDNLPNLKNMCLKIVKKSRWNPLEHRTREYFGSLLHRLPVMRSHPGHGVASALGDRGPSAASVHSEAVTQCLSKNDIYIFFCSIIYYNLILYYTFPGAPPT